MKWIKWGVIKRLIFFAILFSGAISCCGKIPNIGKIKNHRLPDRVDAEKAVLMVTVNLEFGGIPTGFGSSGTGFGIAYHENSTIVMTAGHVCEPLSNKPGAETKLSIVTVDGTELPAKQITISGMHDLCLVKIEKILPIAKIAEEIPANGDKIKYSGYPLGVFIPGTLHHFDGYMGGIDADGNHLYNIPTVGGASGSPIYNEDGEVVAIISAVMVEFEHITFGVGLYNILFFLEENGLTQR